MVAEIRRASPPGLNGKTISATAGASILSAVFCFAVTLSVALLHNFAGAENRVTFFGDSRHYLESCQLLVAQFKTYSTGSAGASLGTLGGGRSLFDDLMLDGPIFPMLPALFFGSGESLPCRSG